MSRQLVFNLAVGIDACEAHPDPTWPVATVIVNKSRRALHLTTIAQVAQSNSAPAVNVDMLPRRRHEGRDAGDAAIRRPGG